MAKSTGFDPVYVGSIPSSPAIMDWKDYNMIVFRAVPYDDVPEEWSTLRWQCTTECPFPAWVALGRNQEKD